MQNPGKSALGLDATLGSLICYLNICIPAGFIYSIIVLVTDKVNKLTRFHAAQSLLLSAAQVVTLIVLQVFIMIVAVATESFALVSVLGLIFWALVFAFLGIGIFAGVKGNKGEIFKLPLIGDLADKWSN